MYALGGGEAGGEKKNTQYHLGLPTCGDGG